MNLTIAKEQLINGLQSVQNVVGIRTTLPILSNVLLKADKNHLELTATDLDVTISCSVEASVKKAGAATVPVKKLFGIVRELSSPEIELEVDEKNQCSVRAGASFYKINGLAAEEFPPMPKFKEDKKVVLPQEKLRSMMKKTSFAISTDESRYVLNGIFISLKEHKMTMVATDGRRLALVDEEVDISEKSQGEFIVIRVSNAGPGIPAAEQDLIFEKFYRGRNVRQRVAGTGMGLSIAREIIEAHGGRIWLKSEPEDGVQFSFTLPTSVFPRRLKDQPVQTLA